MLLGFDLEDPSQCLGFGVHRTDHTEDEAYWLRGMKVFRSVVPEPAAGMDFSTRDHPIQGFQWGDYTAKPDHEYTYKVVAWGGTPGRLRPLAETSVTVRTEPDDDGVHGIWFNRGVAGSQAFVKRFGQCLPPKGADETHPSFPWLSRGLGEAFVRFVKRANGPEWGLRGAFYEFTWQKALKTFKEAADTGADVQLVVHGRDKDSATGDDKDHTAADNRDAVTAAGLDKVITWRTAGNKSALQHNKFLVLTHNGSPVAVWTGSTNLTQGGVYGHLNVGHQIGDTTIAGQFLDYWSQLAEQQNTTALMRTWNETHNEIDLTTNPQDGMTTILSPRATKSTLLSWYADLFDQAVESAHITGAFGINKVFRDKLKTDKDLVRTVMLDQPPDPGQGIPKTDPDVRVVWGDYLRHVGLEQWAAEELTSFNTWVKFVHTKIILIDPMGPSPTTLTGSANYSDNSTSDNEENTIVVRGSDEVSKRVADIYLTEYHRLFMHFVFRDWANPRPGSRATGAAPRLQEKPDWSDAYYEPGSWRERQRKTFSAPVT